LSYEADFDCKDKNFFAIAMLLKKKHLEKIALRRRYCWRFIHFINVSYAFIY